MRVRGVIVVRLGLGGRGIIIVTVSPIADAVLPTKPDAGMSSGSSAVPLDGFKQVIDREGFQEHVGHRQLVQLLHFR